MNVALASHTKWLATVVRRSDEPGPPFRPGVLLNAIVPWLFLATGPYMLLLDAALASELPEKYVVSWFMAGPVAGGLLGIVLNLRFRRPICTSMTIHGSLLAAAAAARLAFPEMVGAYVMAGILISVLALTGLATRMVDYLPLPIVLGMVVGVLLPFALRAVGAVAQSPWLTGATVLVFLASTRYRHRLWGIPPTFWATLFGITAASVTGQANWGEFAFKLATPVVTAPVFSWQGLVELALPITVMVIGVHGTQAAGILRGAGMTYDTKTYTLATGLTSIAAAPLGATPLATMGPPLAMLVSGYRPDQDDHRWTAGVLFGLLLIALGLTSPILASIRRWLPGPLVSTIAGLAVLGILDHYLAHAFSGRFKRGALFAFVVTASGVSFLDIGAPLWGVLAGLAISAMVEPTDFQTIGHGQTSRGAEDGVTGKRTTPTAVTGEANPRVAPD